MPLLALFPFSGFGSASGERMEYLVLKFGDGSQQEYLLADKPSIIFSGDKLIVVSESVTAEFERAAVKEFCFTLLSTGITNPAAKQTVFIEYTDNENIYLSGLDGGEVVLYDTAGRMIDSQRASGDRVRLSLKGAPGGTYLLSYGKTYTIKILKK